MECHIPSEIYNRILKNVEASYGTMPFKLRGIVISQDLLKVTVVILNRESSKSLPQNARNVSSENTPDGLDRRIKECLNTNLRTANIISDVLQKAGIVEIVKIENRISGREVKGTRLLPIWSW